MVIEKKVAPAFEDFIFNWRYETFLLVGGYGSGKSYQVALKIILKLIEEKRTCLVVREVFDTLNLSCFSLFIEILDDLGIYTSDPREFKRGGRRECRVTSTQHPMEIKFFNGSKIVFKGMDKPEKVKSINDVSIVWMEEASEIKYEGFKELQGRIRTPKVSMHFILSCNPVSRENWIYRHFFSRLDDKGKEKVLVDENLFYDQGVVIHDGIYYHHSTPDNNPWLPWQYLKRLDKIREYDIQLYRVARWGEFGVSGTRVLPQLRVARNPQQFRDQVRRLGPENQYFGFDFGFEESFNAVLCMSVDLERSYLYVWDEIYMNHVTDDKFCNLPEMQRLKIRVDNLNAQGYRKMVIADNEDPKAIQYYRQQGFAIRACRNKFAGSRLSNTRKMKRFQRIIVSPKCRNTIRELKDLTYAKDAKGNIIYDQFNIDPHTFSAMWYGLEQVTVADLKDRKYFSR